MKLTLIILNLILLAGCAPAPAAPTPEPTEAPPIEITAPPVVITYPPITATSENTTPIPTPTPTASANLTQGSYYTGPLIAPGIPGIPPPTTPTWPAPAPPPPAPKYYIADIPLPGRTQTVQYVRVGFTRPCKVGEHIQGFAELRDSLSPDAYVRPDEPNTWQVDIIASNHLGQTWQGNVASTTRLDFDYQILRDDTYYFQVTHISPRAKKLHIELTPDANWALMWGGW